MNLHTPPLLSLCMIVKNEQDMLPSFLEMHRDFFDEWVIMDTGSTDRTLDILKDHNIPIHRCDWIDNFADARNAALELCSGQWVCALDADERIAPHDQHTIRDALRQALKGDVADGFILPIKNYIKEDSHTNFTEYCPPDSSYTTVFGGEVDYGYRLTELIRLFRRDKGFQWMSNIHEVLHSDQKEVMENTVRVEDLFIHHLGTLKPSQRKDALYKKISQDLLSSLETEECPKILYESARFIEEHSTKISLLKRALSLAEGDIHILKELANTYMSCGDLDAATATCRTLTTLHPNALEGHLALAHCLPPNDAIDALKTHYTLFRKKALYHYTLAYLYLKTDHISPALSHAKQAFALAPTSPSIAKLHNTLSRQNLY